MIPDDKDIAAEEEIINKNNLDILVLWHMRKSEPDTFSYDAKAVINYVSYTVYGTRPFAGPGEIATSNWAPKLTPG